MAGNGVSCASATAPIAHNVADAMGLRPFFSSPVFEAPKEMSLRNHVLMQLAATEGSQFDNRRRVDNASSMNKLTDIV
jgi:hypothetical protein